MRHDLEVTTQVLSGVAQKVVETAPVPVVTVRADT